MDRRWLAVVMAITLAVGLIGRPVRAKAAIQAQDDPVAQCAEGIRLFHNGRQAEALPLLEAGFAGRQKAAFANPDDLGECALALGMLRNNADNWAGGLEVYAVALEIFQASGNREFTAMTLNNIGLAYHDQGRNPGALEAFQQALTIAREVGDRAGEGTILNNIGLVYAAQGWYAEALEDYQQALAIAREVGDRAGEGRTLINIGSVYDDQGRYAEALEAYQQALAIQQESGNKALEGATLNNIGAVYVDQGRYAEALEAHRQALTIAREVGDRSGEATALTNIGVTHGDQGRYVEALEALQQALIIRREVGDRAGEGTTLTNIGASYERQGRYAEALDANQQALAVAREVGDQAGEGRTLTNIGLVYYDQGRYGEALEAYQQAQAIAREVGDRPGEGMTLNNIGLVYRGQGRYGEALEVYQQALAIGREVGDQAGEGMRLNNIGMVYYDQGRHAESLEAYQQALAIAREVGDRPGQGTILNNIGVVYGDQSQYAEALEAHQQALALAREVGDRAGEGTTLSNIAVVHEKQRRYSEALEVYQQALAIQQELGDRVGEGRTLNNIGQVYYTQGRYGEALEAYQQALAIAHEVGNRAGEGATLYNLGAAYQVQGEADQSLAYYEQAMDMSDAVRASAGSEAGRAAFIAQYSGLYSRAAGLYHRQGQDEKAFSTSERGRARAFLDSLATGQVELSDSEAAGLLADEQEAYAGWQAVQDALVQARALEPADPALVAELEAQLAAAEKVHAAALAAIEARHDQLAALVPGRSAVLELAEVQARLNDQTSLVSYYVLGDEGSLAFVITHDSFSAVDLPDATPDNLRSALAGLYQWANLEDANPRPLQDLHAWLVAPLADRLPTPLVGIIPHQLLHYVPFGALTDGQTTFGQQHTLFSLPSASALPFIEQNAGQAHGSGAVVFGNPDTGDAGLAPLAHAGQEAAGVANLLGAEASTGKEASETRLRSEAGGAGVIHLAAHGSFNTANPLYSAIHLAPQGRDDGLLQVHEVYGLNLRSTDLVVLSACQSNVGELSAGDEWVGMTRAFFFAGTPTVIASLWPVDDAATEELMVAFYRHRQSGLGKAEALQAAQAEIRERYRSPYYWAGFVLSGDPGAITGSAAAPASTHRGSSLCGWWPLAVVAVGILLVPPAWWLVKRRRKR